MNEIRLTRGDPNSIILWTVNEILLVDHELPDKWEASGPIIGGDDIKKISRTASTPTLNRSGGIR